MNHTTQSLALDTRAARRRSTSRALIGASILATALIGCAQDDNEPTQEDYDDVATSVGGLVGGGSGEVTSFNDGLSTALGTPPAGFSLSANGQIEGERGGLSFSYEVSCSDASGDLMTLCDDTTDSASLIVDWSGNYDGNLWQFTISRTGDWSITGLQSDAAVFNGQGTFDVTSASQSIDGRVSRTFALSYAASYQDITIDTASENLLGGTIIYNVHAERQVDGRNNEREGEFDITAEVSFDDSGVASLVLDGSHSYRINLATGTVSPE